jgi:hypothetical protein
LVKKSDVCMMPERDRERARERASETVRDLDTVCVCQYMLGESVCHSSALVMRISAVCKAL